MLYRRIVVLMLFPRKQHDTNADSTAIILTAILSGFPAE